MITCTLGLRWVIQLQMERHEAWGLTVLRIVVGGVFLTHGSHRLFVERFSGVGREMALLRVPLPEAAGVAVTLLEFLGGIALVLGLFTRWAAILLAVEMAVALVAVHFAAGFFLPRGIEYPLILLAACVALALAGPGAAALDGKILPAEFWK